MNEPMEVSGTDSKTGYKNRSHNMNTDMSAEQRDNTKKERNPSIELLRIISMLLIIAHHYVVNSGLIGGGPISQNPTEFRAVFLMSYGAFGKVCINSFVFITGYYMCKSDITLRKFMKLFCEVMFYKIIINSIFWITGYAPFTPKTFFYGICPIINISTGFVSAYFLFFLSIPFLNTLIRNISQRDHIKLIALCSFTYIFLGTVKPWFSVTMNYVSWFIVVYFIASYVALYPKKIYQNCRLWALITVACIALCLFTVIGSRLLWKGKNPYLFVSDSNAALAVLTGVSAFFLFKNIKIRRCNKIINRVAASTYGVLLIHANSDTMREWLWKTMLKNVEVYYKSWWYIHALLSPLVIFVICICIDMLRIQFVEKPFFRVWDKHQRKKIAG